VKITFYATVQEERHLLPLHFQVEQGYKLPFRDNFKYIIRIIENKLLGCRLLVLARSLKVSLLWTAAAGEAFSCCSWTSYDRSSNGERSCAACEVVAEAEVHRGLAQGSRQQQQ
jgi:hypothetical protein